jgi:glycosyltransferase involved in cell wall biosynthesis
MPNYNDARFLRESLPALLEQSYPVLQIIVVDDGSSDGSVAVLSEYAKRDARLRFLVNEKNMGTVLSVARAQAEATGEYIYFASADDRVLPGFFEKAVKLLEEHPKASLCWTDPCHFFESGGPLYSRRTGITTGPAYVSAQDLAEAYRSGRLSAPMHAAPALLRRSAYLAAGGLLPELRWYSDFFVTLIMAFRTGMCYLPEALTSTRVQRTSYSRAGSAQKKVQREVLTRLLDLLLSPAYQDVAPLVKQSGVLSYFGWPMLQLSLRDSRYRQLLHPRFLRRGLYFSAKHTVRKLAPLSFERFYFFARQLLRARTQPFPASANPRAPR